MSEDDTPFETCWHCGDTIDARPLPRCQYCPDECDTKGCEEPGCTEYEAQRHPVCEEYPVTVEHRRLLARITELEARLRGNRAQVRDVYRVEVDGAEVFWVSARSHSEAMGLCVLTSAGVLPVDAVPNVLASKYGSDGRDWGKFEVSRIDEERARATPLYCDVVGDTDMWTEHLRLDQPQVLSCSEWP